MKLAIIMPPIYPLPSLNGGGVERLTEIFLRGNEHSPDPIDITLFCRWDSRSEEAAKEFLHTRFVYVHTTKSEPLSNRFECRLRKKIGQITPVRRDYLRGLLRELKRGEYDEILLENCFEFARDLSRATKKPLILHAHNRFFGEDFPDAAKSFRYINKFIFVSEYLKSSAVAAGVPSERSEVLYDCVDTSLFDARRFDDIRAEKRAKYGLGDDDMLAVFVGLLTPEKGSVELVKALAQSNFSAAKLKLLIVGSAQYGENMRDDYREQLELAAPEGRVIFTGSVKSASTARFLARADFAVVPSVWEEPAGLPVLEAMSTGLTLIVSDSGGIGEYAGEYADAGGCIVVKRGLGYVNSLAKAIDKTAERLHSDPGWRRENAAAARRIAEKYDSGAYYDRLREIIKNENN